MDSRHGSVVAAQLRLRLRVGITALFGVIIGGTIGYRLLEGWSWLLSLYMTVITISTVGYKEVGELSDTSKLFTIALILCGVGSIAIAGSSALEWMIEQHSSQWARRRKMNKLISAIKGHIIVCGYGRMGRHVVNELEPHDADFVVIEKDPAVCEAIIEKGMKTVNGDATDEAILESAGIKQASALVAALTTDADNLFLTLTAHGINPDLKIIVRAGEQSSHAKFLRAGATRVVSPYAIGADHIVQLLLRPRVVDFIELVTQQGAVELNIDQIGLKPDSPLCGKTLAESRARQTLGRMILAIKKKNGETIFDPAPNTLLEPDDVLITVGRGRDADDTLHKE